MTSIAEPPVETSAADIRGMLRAAASSEAAPFSLAEIEAVLAQDPTGAMALDWAYRRALGLREDSRPRAVSEAAASSRR